MGLTDPTSGTGYSTGDHVNRSAWSVMATNLSRMMNGAVGPDITSDATQDLDISAHSVFRVTATTSAERELVIRNDVAEGGFGPHGIGAGRTIYVRQDFNFRYIWIRFDCNTSLGKWTITSDQAQGFSTSTESICNSGSLSASTEESVCLYWAGSQWYPILWTAGINVLL